MLSAGGFLAVSFLKNRESTEDLDYLLEPEWAHDSDIKKSLYSTIEKVSEKLHFTRGWINDEMAFFVSDQSRQRLYEKAEEQNIVLWEGANLRILAVPLEWALERKLRRINNEKQNESVKRLTDLDDALTILKYLREQNRGPLDKEYIRTLNICSTEMLPDHRTMDRIASEYRKKYNEEAFA